MPPSQRVPEDPPQGAADALERRVAFDQPLVGGDLDRVMLGDRLCGFLRTLQSTCPQSADVCVLEMLAGCPGLAFAALGQVVAGQPPVDDAFGILDLAVAHEMDRPRQRVDQQLTFIHAIPPSRSRSFLRCLLYTSPSPRD